jgi:hypothetical protein
MNELTKWKGHLNRLKGNVYPVRYFLAKDVPEGDLRKIGRCVYVDCRKAYDMAQGRGVWVCMFDTDKGSFCLTWVNSKMIKFKDQVRDGAELKGLFKALTKNVRDTHKRSR